MGDGSGVAVDVELSLSFEELLSEDPEINPVQPARRALAAPAEPVR